METRFRFQKWVGQGGDSDHYPVFLKISNGNNKPSCLFKFNANWLNDESFVSLLKERRNVYEKGFQVSPFENFVGNLKNIKYVSIKWSVKKKEPYECDIRNIENNLVEKYNRVRFGFESEEEK